MRNARWWRLLAYVTGSVNQELLTRNEYLATENRILRAKLLSRLRLSNSERTTLAEIGKRLGRKALREVASVAKPDTCVSPKLNLATARRWERNVARAHRAFQFTKVLANVALRTRWIALSPFRFDAESPLMDMLRH
jgi:hypothetical protein